jgi:hypothetical protein
MHLIGSKKKLICNGLPNTHLENKQPISSGNFIITQQAFFPDTNPKHDISVQYAPTKLVKKNSSYFCICRIKKFDNFVDKE